MMHNIRKHKMNDIKPPYAHREGRRKYCWQSLVSEKWMLVPYDDGMAEQAQAKRIRSAAASKGMRVSVRQSADGWIVDLKDDVKA